MAGSFLYATSSDAIERVASSAELWTRDGRCSFPFRFVGLKITTENANVLV